MMQDNTMRCETCGKTFEEMPIIEKPFRFAFLADVVSLSQNTRDGRKQENICLPCLSNEIDALKENCGPTTKITVSITDI